MKECPLRMELQGRVFHDVKPIVNSFEFPDLTIAEEESDMREIIYWDQDNKASVLCHVEEEENNDEEGKVVQNAMFREDSSYDARWFFEDRNFKYYKATFAKGEDARVVEAFNQLLALLE